MQGLYSIGPRPGDDWPSVSRVLYALYDCATASSRLVRAQDPFGTLFAKARGSVSAAHSEVLDAGEA